MAPPQDGPSPGGGWVGAPVLKKTPGSNNFEKRQGEKLFLGGLTVPCLHPSGSLQRRRLFLTLNCLALVEGIDGISCRSIRSCTCVCIIVFHRGPCLLSIYLLHFLFSEFLWVVSLHLFCWLGDKQQKLAMWGFGAFFTVLCHVFVPPVSIFLLTKASIWNRICQPNKFK